VPLLASMLEGMLPVEARFSFDALALARAAGFALLVALIFAAPPLIAAREVTAMALFRSGAVGRAKVWRAAALPVGGGIVLLVGLVLLGARDPLLNLWFIVGAAAVLALLAAVIVLLAPTFRALLTYAVDRSRSHTRTLLAGLPHPRPPSLLVLSISRT